MLAENYWSGGLLTEIWRVNESLPKYLVDHARAHCGKLQGKRIVVLGYTFKGDADDIRDSLAPKLIRYLQREAPATIVVSDPFITAQQVEQVPGLVFTADLDAALAGADLVMIAANHSVYAKSREKILDAASRSGARVVDIWNICGQSRVLIDQQTLAAQTLLKVRRPSQRGVAA
jgi:UDP-N-acetyl-D-mannosaminuronate dehydrogenase